MTWHDDVKVNHGVSTPASLLRAWLFSPEIRLVLKFRMASALAGRSAVGRLLSLMLWRGIVSANGCFLSLKSRIGPALRLPHPVGIVIRDGVRVGSRMTIFQNVTWA